MRTIKKMRHGLLLTAIIASPVYAELADGPYFNLWTGFAGNGEEGQGDYLALCGVAAGCSGASGVGTTDNPGTVTDFGYAIFRTALPNSGAGSGNIDPFLRFQHNEGDALGSATTEAAFNTDYNSGPTGFKVGTIYNAGSNDTVFDGTTVYMANQAKDVDAGKDFNHAIRLGDLVADANGYFVFRLDVNEPGGNKSNILLDELQLFVAGDNTLSDYELDKSAGNPEGSPVSGALKGATKVWDMDFNKFPGGIGDANNNGVTPSSPAGERLGGIMLDSVLSSGPSNGSGDFDMEFLVHKSLFDSFLAEDFVYLYNFMGQADQCRNNGPDCVDGASTAGFEEWAAEVEPSTEPPCCGGGGGVPEPGTAFLMAAGVVGLLRANRSRGTTIADKLST